MSGMNEGCSSAASFLPVPSIPAGVGVAVLSFVALKSKCAGYVFVVYYNITFRVGDERDGDVTVSPFLCIFYHVLFHYR
jgi:hypothetical protein